MDDYFTLLESILQGDLKEKIPIKRDKSVDVRSPYNLVAEGKKRAFFDLSIRLGSGSSLSSRDLSVTETFFA